MIVMEFSMIPLDKGPSFSSYVARLITIVESSGLDYRLTAMGTIVEGNWDDLISLLTNCMDELRKEANRISLQVKFDYRKGTSSRLEGKIKSVEEKAGKSFKVNGLEKNREPRGTPTKAKVPKISV